MEYLDRARAKQEALADEYKRLSASLKGKSSKELEALHVDLMAVSEILRKAVALSKLKISDADIVEFCAPPQPVTKEVTSKAKKEEKKESKKEEAWKTSKGK